MGARGKQNCFKNPLIRKTLRIERPRFPKSFHIAPPRSITFLSPKMTPSFQPPNHQGVAIAPFSESRDEFVISSPLINASYKMAVRVSGNVDKPSSFREPLCPEETAFGQTSSAPP